MQLQIKDLLNGMSSLQYLSGLKLKSSVSFKVGTFLRKAQVDLEYFQEHQAKLIASYSSKDEKGESIVKDIEGYTKDINEVMELKCETLIPPIVNIDDIKAETITPARLGGALWILNLDLPKDAEARSYSDLKNFDVITAYNEMNNLLSSEFTPSECLHVLRILKSLKDGIERIGAEEQKIVDAIKAEAPIGDAEDKEAAIAALDEQVGKALGEHRKKGLTTPIVVPTLYLSSIEHLNLTPSLFSSILWFVSEEDFVEVDVTEDAEEAVAENV